MQRKRGARRRVNPIEMSKPSRSVPLLALVTIAGAFGCGGPDQTDDWSSTSDAFQEERVPLDERALELAETPPLPVMGGTMHITADGEWLIATDPDRDQIHVVDVHQGVQTHMIALDPGVQPWRIAEDSTGTVHIVLRGDGTVASMRPEDLQVQVTASLCPQPRGIAVDEADDVWVACAGGELVVVHDGIVAGREDAPVDVRDIWFDEGERFVSTFRDARVYGPDGDTYRLPNLARASRFASNGETLHPSVAWRTRPLPAGGYIMVHQLATDRPLSLTTGDADDGPADPGGDDDGFGDGSGGGVDGGSDYGGGESSCMGIVTTAVTIGDRHGDMITTGPIAKGIGAVDVAFDGTKTRVAIVSAAGNFEGEHRVIVFSAGHLRDPQPDRCQDQHWLQKVPGQPVAAVFDQIGRLYVQMSEPAQIVRYDIDGNGQSRIGLTGKSRADTGHTLFHELGAAEISCASCHPEGADDGRVWNFAPIGPRHTPALDVGLAGTEPLHWQGDLADFAALVDEVMVGRMGLPGQPPERAAAMERYVYAFDSGPARRHDSSTVARGAQAYASLGCASCHGSGAQPPADFGFGFMLQSPPLSGVGLHPPYMHDGRAATLRDAVMDMIGRVTPAATVDAGMVDDLVAYLETL